MDSFLHGMDKNFNVSKEEKDSNMRLSLESDSKMTNHEIPILLFRKASIFSLIKEILYLILWITKAIGVTLVIKMIKKNHSQVLTLSHSQTKKFEQKCKFIYWVRKLEFIFFNMVLTDSLFILTHGLAVISLEGIKLELNSMDYFREKALFILRLVGSLLIFMAILADILELFIISINISKEIYYTIPQYKLDKLKDSNFKANKRICKEINSSS